MAASRRAGGQSEALFGLFARRRHTLSHNNILLLLFPLPLPSPSSRSAPIYKILSRWGVLATTGHSSNFVQFLEIPTDRGDITNNEGHADCAHWIKAGVAAFTQLKF